MRKLLKFLTGRLFLSFVFILLQIIVLINIFGFAEHYALWIQLFSAFSIMMALFVSVRDHLNPAYKIGWMLIFMLLPIYGGLLYIFLGTRKLGPKLKRQLTAFNEFHDKGMENISLSAALPTQALEGYDATLFRQERYITGITGFPVWSNTEVEYFADGEDWLLDVLKEIKAAKSFIFLEFFIIAQGEVFSALVSELVAKVQQGVLVRLMFDDVGSISTIPAHHERYLRSLGLEVIAFNPLRAHINNRLNSRDHRKVVVIDGNIGYTGGLNFADEYANRQIRFGHWKDTGVKLKGDAVWNLTLMFLQLWSFSSKKPVDFAPFKPTIQYKTDGFVQPFGDNPLDNHNVAENSYIQIISMAKKYVWITTPYLVLDNEMITVLKLAAQSGVDVRIITPKMPDKWYVFLVTQANYYSLIDGGVKIFEYTPGFIHAKMCISDDKVAIIGTINMDYRSFFLHFENAVLFYGSSVVTSVYTDIVKIMDVSQRITLDFLEARPWYKRLLGTFLRLAAPLL
ncbi:MAG TPA: cardiolipin synthase, partial [Sphaerochaeta sp.]|nr:cardiolipin synthase [Sphaerochaeta sp.]